MHFSLRRGAAAGRRSGHVLVGEGPRDAERRPRVRLPRRAGPRGGFSLVSRPGCQRRVLQNGQAPVVFSEIPFKRVRGRKKYSIEIYAFIAQYGFTQSR